ncbi:hypothetical protein LX70_00561 [Defluviimonas denitrificans]|jgi:hypothetical protein|uniref:Uncharacterized protein n=1 Tax=Albidovulum denitrificans TaxID=404881 RepID=A0A2S8SDJ4_9RHOB|nr:hypothetical protein [Defluviimonas denitrificans]PQV58748.1 hypothetical protein LX70_00561 [Defluviimonas denitrificans]
MKTDVSNAVEIALSRLVVAHSIKAAVALDPKAAAGVRQGAHEALVAASWKFVEAMQAANA